MSYWCSKQYIIKVHDNAIGVVTIIKPDDTSAEQFTIMSSNGDFLNVNHMSCIDSEYTTLIEFGLPELEIVDKSLASSGTYYNVLLKKPKSI